MMNQEKAIIEVVKKAHNNKGLFSESRFSTNGGIWLTLIFEDHDGITNFYYDIMRINVGKLTRLLGANQIEVMV